MISNWKELSIGKYQEICHINEELAEDEIALANRQMKIVSVLSGRAVEDLETMPILEYMALEGKTSFLNEEIPKEEVTLEKGDILEVGGRRFKVCTDVTRMTAEQFIAFQATAKQLDVDIIPFLSTMIVPEGSNFGKGYSIDEVQEVLRDGISMVEANSLASFFLNSLQDFIRYIRTCLEEISEKDIPEKEAKMTILNQALEILSMTSGDGGTR